MRFQSFVVRRRFRVVKIAALVSSLVLVIAYVNYRATGHWLPISKSDRMSHAPTVREASTLPDADSGQGSHAESQQLLFSSSKDGPVFLPQSDAASEIMYGSKSGIVFEPEVDPPASAPVPTPMDGNPHRDGSHEP
jgi:hypothetical protein